MDLPFSLLLLLINFVHSVWSNGIGGPLFGSMGGFPQFRLSLRGCCFHSTVRPVFPFDSFPVLVVSD